MLKNLKIPNRILRSLSRETSSGRFIPEMDGLRFLAITMVVLFHLNGYLMKKASFYEHSIAGPDWLCRTALLGFHGVELFFIISGFILALPFAQHHLRGGTRVNLRKYYLRRLTRLEPPYFVTIFLLITLSLIMHQTSATAIYLHLTASLLYLHNLIYSAPSTVIGVAWSLEIEVQFYLLVPALTMLFAIRNSARRRALIVGLIFVIETAQSLFLHAPRFQLSILGYLQFFLTGFLLADLFIVSWNTLPLPRWRWDVLTLICVPSLWFVLQSDIATHWLFPALAFIVYCAAFQGSWTNRIFTNRWITVIGGMCYSIYLIHYEVISLVARFTKSIGARLPDPIYLILQFAIVGSFILAICGIYFILLEKPCMHRDWPQRLWEFVMQRHEQQEAQPGFAD